MLPRDIALAILTMAIWGFNFVVIKVGLSSFPPLLFSALRFTLAAFPLVLFIGSPPVRWRYIFGIGLALGVAKFGLLFISLSSNPVWGGMPAGLASLVLQVQVFFTMLFAAFFLKERPRPIQLLGMAVAFTGVCLLASNTGQSGPIKALGIVLLAAAAWGVSNILMRLAQPPDVLRMIVWISVIPPLPLLALSFVFEGSEEIFNALTQMNWVGFSALVYVTVVSTLFGFAVWNALLKRYQANLVAPFALLVPVFGIISARLFLNERLTSSQWFAVILVLSGVAINIWWTRPLPVHKKPVEN